MKRFGLHAQRETVFVESSVFEQTRTDQMPDIAELAQVKEILHDLGSILLKRALLKRAAQANPLPYRGLPSNSRYIFLSKSFYSRIKSKKKLAPHKVV